MPLTVGTFFAKDEPAGHAGTFTLLTSEDAVTSAVNGQPSHRGDNQELFPGFVDAVPCGDAGR